MMQGNTKLKFRFINLWNELFYFLTESVMPGAESDSPRLLEPDDKVTLMFRNFDNLITWNGITSQKTRTFNITVVTTTNLEDLGRFSRRLRVFFSKIEGVFLEDWGCFSRRLRAFFSKIEGVFLENWGCFSRRLRVFFSKIEGFTTWCWRTNSHQTDRKLKGGRRNVIPKSW